MFFYLILLFILLPALELYLLIEIGTVIGGGNTIMIIILTGIVGAALARYQGFVVFTKIQDDLSRGLMPSGQLMDGLMILVGGIFLLTPGFITDTIGFLLLIPLTRQLIRYLVQKKFEQMIRNGNVHISGSSPHHRRFDGDYDDIDVG